MLNITVPPGPAHSAFIRAGPCTPTPRSSHSLSRRQPGPVRQLRRRATAETEVRRPRMPRAAAVGWDTVGMPPAGRSQAPRAPRGTPTARPPRSPLLFPSLPRRRPSRSNVTEPLTRSLVTNSSPLPSQAPPLSPPFPHLYRHLRPPEASPSRQILPSATAVFSLFGERPPSSVIPKLELNLSSPFHTGAARPLHARRRPPEQPSRR
jgi:hypothetical protein